jgi:hypothetical protein
MLCYSKQTEDLDNVIVVVVNLDPHHSQAGWVELPLPKTSASIPRSRIRCTSCSPARAISGMGRGTMCMWIRRACRRNLSRAPPAAPGAGFRLFFLTDTEEHEPQSAKDSSSDDPG